MNSATNTGYCDACGCLCCACAEYAKASEALAPAAEETALETFVLLPTVADQLELEIARGEIPAMYVRDLRAKAKGSHYTSVQELMAACLNDTWS